jgi:GNAT superfamily N-acetyltransferase
MPTTEATIIREALIGDAVQIASLISELGYSATEQFVRDRLTQLSSSAADMVFIAEHAGEIGGFLSFHVLPLFHVEGNLGRITALAVSPRFRRCRIGRELVAAAERFAWSHGCVRGELTSGDHRAEAHAFYEAVGYRQETRRFLKAHPRQKPEPKGVGH